ncbi:HU family DNA-binding protein [Candidatus Uhrbacteria bacterium]|nr:HU family DNA-binding protein [Candidatus Uhrbacteria bacterium]
MNKAELINYLSEKVGVTKKQAEDMVESFVEVVTSTLKSGGEVNIAGFGAFMAKTRAARMGVNPQKPTEKIQINAVTVPKFKAGKGLKDALKHSGLAAAAAATPAAAPSAPMAPSM